MDAETRRLLKQGLVLFASMTLTNDRITTPRQRQGVRAWIRRAKKVVLRGR